MSNTLIAVLAALMSLLPLSAVAAESDADKQEWAAWYQRSVELRRLDQRAMARELAQAGRQVPIKPVPHDKFGFDPDQPVGFYSTDAGRRVADIVLSYQTPSGGWSKRVDMSSHFRRRGEAFGLSKGYQPTFDNYATSTQMHVLARAYAATGEDKYRAAFRRALDLILDAQMPNGGWPQSYPLDGGYHNLITYNDKSQVNLLELLRPVVEASAPYDLATAEQRNRAANALIRGVQCLLITQVVIGGELTIWGAQHDPFTLAPAAARAFEPAALASQESAEILLFLMDLPQPPAAVVQAVEAAMRWFRARQLAGVRWDKLKGELVNDESAKPHWARFYDPVSQEPVFGDRDGAVYTQVSQVSLERRLGYGWYSTAPAKLEKAFTAWKQTLAQKP
ncbi:pectate lyase [Simiduia agarivorans]|uniref:Pectate lyase n=1 Tax=Simiduia agarivorans (strain DSM 21679 / JCM 13881 / BCRC 17597 / SA1) TaxID=1117647 RepID=K4KLZ3_SIMAS|nr:pectate lyase [Simiduia agarivorans]AFU99235.1 pectate lyase [Simiduia agarivorans SA1 = DSM 21679]